MKTRALSMWVMAAAVLVAACDGRVIGSPSNLTGPGGSTTPPPGNQTTTHPDGGGTTSDGGTSGGGNVCAQGTAWRGFGGQDLTSATSVSPGRTLQPVGQDLRRSKGYSALQGEYQRVTSNNPSLVTTMATTFAAPPARWYQEPSFTAVSLYAAYRIAFEDCLTLTGSGNTYSAAPTTSTATTVCSTLQNQFWDRAPTQQEVSDCATYAVTGTTAETNPNRQWAYVCASVLSSAGFLTY